MSKALIAGINQVAIDKGLDREIIFEAIEAALISAYKRNYGSVANVSAEVDRVNGDMRVLTEREVVEDVMNERTEILLEDAKNVESESELGDVIKVESKPDDFGRIAAQTAKQVILQRIREAERDIVYENFVHRVGEIISAQVRSVDGQSGALTVLLDDKHECLIMREDCIASEQLRRGDYIKVFVADVHKSTRGPVIKLSRTHKDLLRRLLEQEIPEIRDGLVEIKDIAREPGARSKAAVFATRQNIDPVGSCVGMRGLRIQNVVNELGGEKIDVVEWNSEPFNYISNALSPAKVTSVYLQNEENSIKTAIVIVPDRQLSLAIGKAGQNARLAAKLTGWRIDIKSETESIAEGLDKMIDAQRSAAKESEGDILSRVEEMLRQEDPNKASFEADDKMREAARRIEEGEQEPLETLEPSGIEFPSLETLNKLTSEEQGKSSSGMSLEEAAAAISSGNTQFSESFPVFEPEMVEPFSKSEDTLTEVAADLTIDSSKSTESEEAEELPEMITADMLRARMQQRSTDDAELEIPAELLVGLEDDEQKEPTKKEKSKKSKAKKADSKKKAKSKTKSADDDGLSDFF